MGKIESYLVLEKNEFFTNDEYPVCFLCGANENKDICGLENHHIFFGKGKRKLSDKYSLVVRLCGCECHRTGKNSAHKNRKTDLKLKKYGQLKAMEENKWTTEDFKKVFGKNYL